jgi:hypothetical protein
MTWFNQTSMHNGYELDSIFGIEVSEASNEEIRQYANLAQGIIPRIIRRTIKRKSQLSYIGEKSIQYNPEVFSLDNKYLSGYWQSEHYFTEIEEELREKFVFPVHERRDDAFSSLLNSIGEDVNSVSLHVRRGDYIEDKKNDKSGILFNGIKYFLKPQVNLGGVCTLNYYKNAINYLKSWHLHPSFYVFSDDIDWCMKNFSFLDSSVVYVDINMGKSSYWDMFLMSQCKHNIIANSSFSWWGAWLNSNKEKIVVAPDSWFENGYIGDIIPEGWVTLPTL